MCMYCMAAIDRKREIEEEKKTKRNTYTRKQYSQKINQKLKTEKQNKNAYLNASTIQNDDRQIMILFIQCKQPYTIICVIQTCSTRSIHFRKLNLLFRPRAALCYALRFSKPNRTKGK